MQAIASLSILDDTIPQEFIRSEYEQPGITTFIGPVPDIPVINLSKRETLVQEIRSASEEWGIFQVVNHGIPEKVIKELQSVGKEFFELPLEEKEKYAVKPGSFEGYGTKLQKEPEGKKAWVDYLFHNVWPPSKVNYDIWPHNPPSYRFIILHFRKYAFLLSFSFTYVMHELKGEIFKQRSK